MTTSVPLPCRATDTVEPAREISQRADDDRHNDQIAQPAELTDVVAADGRRRFQRAAAGKDAHAAKHRPFVLVEEIEAPIDQRSERLLPGQAFSARVSEQPESFVQPCQDLLWPQHGRFRRRELERERNSVEPSADIGDRVRVVGRQRELARCRACALREEFDRGVELQDVHVVDELAFDVERLSRRRQDRRVRTGAQDCVRHQRRGGKYVLTAIENQKHVLVGDRPGYRVRYGVFRRSHFERRGGLCGHGVPVVGE